VHVDEGVPAGGVLAGDEDGVRVADEPDVRQASRANPDEFVRLV
jgi:hypothetical protein